MDIKINTDKYEKEFGMKPSGRNNWKFTIETLHSNDQVCEETISGGNNLPDFSEALEMLDCHISEYTNRYNGRIKSVHVSPRSKTINHWMYSDGSFKPTEKLGTLD